MPSEPAPSRGGDGIQVISRAAEMMRALAQSPGGLTQADLGERLGLARTTVHRILGTLLDEELVTASHQRGRYRLGPAITRMAGAVRRDFLGAIHPLLEDLSRQAAETVDLSILNGGVVTFLDQVVAPNMLRAVSAIGESFPVHACAPGKAFLAALPDSPIASGLPAKLQALTPSTITDLAILREELAEVRRTGLAYDREEHTTGICAAAVFLGKTELGPMAVSMPMPSQRFYGHEEEVGRWLLGFRRAWSEAMAG